jgi:hypothetical protein
MITTQIIFGIIGETSSVIFRYYSNPTDYYPTSDPIFLIGSHRSTYRV